MQNLLRTGIFFFFISFLISIERTVALPLLSLLLATHFLAHSSRVEKGVGVVLFGLLLSISYTIPFWFGTLLIGCGVFVLEQRIQLFQRQGVAEGIFLFFALLTISFVSHYPVTTVSLLYYFFLVFLFVLSTRFWEKKRGSEWRSR